MIIHNILAMDLNYKTEIKTRVGELKSSGRTALTLKTLARHLEIQYTYLSRILNSKEEHLKEDVLFEALNFLEFSDLKIQKLMNLRILQGSSSPSRRARASQQLAMLQEKEFSDAEEKGRIESEIIAETNFMLDPYATIVLVSINIPKVRKNPRCLLEPLGLQEEELKGILERIEAAGFIELGDSTLEVRKIKSPKLHFRNDNQLMRLHQQQLKTLSNTLLPKISENRKRSFMATFVADGPAFEEIKEEFAGFLKKVEKISQSTKAAKTYQLSFDFFDWV